MTSSPDQRPAPLASPQVRPLPRWRLNLAAVLVVTLCCLICWACFTLGLSESNIVMIFLAGVALVAARCGQGPAIVASVLSVAVFDFFFVHPIFGFNPTDTQYFITLTVMLGIGLAISELVARLRVQLHAVREQEQLAAQAQVQVQSEQLRNSLLSAVSHDLRTPLATIAVTAGSLLEDSRKSPAEQRELLQTVVDESLRLSRQVENLLDMARFDAGAVVIDRQWLVAEELIGVALARVRRELGERQVQVQIASDFPLLSVSEELFERMLVNLLDNAIRYTPNGSRLEITAAADGNWTELRIADNGPGLPAGSEGRFFERFFRGRSIVADGQRGIGLGLAICQAIAQAHGGNITASNRLGGGAEFVIRLPRPTNEPPAALYELPAQTDA